MKDKKKRLSILSNLEKYAFYGLPDFDHEEQQQYLIFNLKEESLIESCPSLHTKVYYALQLGYFKAKNAFFKFSLRDPAQGDINFITARYCNSQTLSVFKITKHENYLQRQKICELFGYRLWPNAFLPEVSCHAKMTARRDITPNFIANELLSFLKSQKIIRPGYTTLQDIVSTALTQE